MSDWTASEAREFLSIIRGEAEKVAKDFGDRQSSIYACLAVVTDIDESGDISVRLLSSPADGSQDFVVPNLSGSVIEAGDSVWLHYWGDYTNAYIGIRNGSDSIPISSGLTQTQVVNLVYPVGAIYMSVSSTSPASLFGGTWAAWGTGRVPVGIDANDASFNTVEETGGAKTVDISHVHGATNSLNGTLEAMIGSGNSETDSIAFRAGNNNTCLVSNYKVNGTWSVPTAINSHNTVIYGATAIGGNATLNNLQPYVTCYMWKRTA